MTGKDELLNAAADAVFTGTMTAGAGAGDTTDTADTTPQEAIRTLALGVFDAIDAHPWIGTQLARAPARWTGARPTRHLSGWGRR